MSYNGVIPNTAVDSITCRGPKEKSGRPHVISYVKYKGTPRATDFFMSVLPRTTTEYCILTVSSHSEALVIV